MYPIGWILYNTSTNKQENKVTSKSSPKPTPIKNKTITVSITNIGGKHQSNGCGYLNKSKIPIPLNEAKQSYNPCKVCIHLHKERAEYESYNR
jgi:hypothetical protein